MKALGIGLSLLLVCGFVFAQTDDQTYTGCLTNGGSIINVAIDDEPAKPCTGNQTQISWNAQGPKGDKGDTGDTGEKGDDGDQGVPGQNGLNGENGENGLNGEQGPPGAAAPRYQFVAVSTDTFTGDKGVMVLSDSCKGHGARMCTTEEVLSSFYDTTKATTPRYFEDAWVRPTIVAPYQGGNGLADISGIILVQTSLSCIGWTNASQGYWGTVVTGYLSGVWGGINIGQCDSERPVACCAPVEP